MHYKKLLLQWYKNYGRKELPWRNTTDPYAILLSEVMLQQTQVKTVLERFYYPFLERFPSLSALAEANIDEVMKYWQGLGYYNRAVNLHKTAKIIAQTLPDSVDELIALPGIGKNTAHAVAAFAFHKPVPVMEANVKRVIHRLYAKELLSEKQLWDYAEVLLDRQNPFDYNQAMMDIGAIICTKSQPKCMLCPLAGICKGKEYPELYPALKSKKKTPIRQKYIVIFSYQDSQGGVYYYLEQRQGRFLKNLYGFNEYDIDKAIVFDNKIHKPHEGFYIGIVKQTYSHFQLQARVYLLDIDAPLTAGGWYSLPELKQLPVSMADVKVIDLLEKQHAPQSV